MKPTPILSCMALVATGCISVDSSRTSGELAAARREAAREIAAAAVLPAPAGTADEASGSRPAWVLAESAGARLPRIAGELSLPDAVGTALGNNLSLRAALFRRDEASAAVVAERSAAYPDLGLSAGVDSDLGERDGNPDTFSAGAKITQPLWRSGAVSAGIRYARLYAAAADASIEAQTQATIEQAAREYLDVLLAQKLVAVYEESVAVAERMLATANNKRAAGIAADYEVLRAEVEVASSRSDLLKKQNALRMARVALLHTMGVDQDSDISISGEIGYAPCDADRGELVAIALANRPDLVQAEAAVRMAEENVSIVRSSYGPSADLYASGVFRNPDPYDGTKDEWGDSWKAGATLAFTLFDGLERRGKLDQAIARQRQAEAELRNAEEAVRVEVAQAVLALRNADELYQSQKKNIDLAREALRMVESGHRIGRNTQIEVLDARSALTEAVGGYHQALHNLATARLRLQLAIGTLSAETLVASENGVEVR